MAEKTEAKKAAEKTSNLEKEYIIPLREKIRSVPRYKKTNKAVKTVKEFLAKHMKVYDRDLKNIKIDKYLNEALWRRGIRNPPSKIKVKAIKEGDIVRVELSELPDKLKFKKAREEKRDQKALEVIDKKKAAAKAEEAAKKAKAEEKTEEEKSEEKEKAKAGAEATAQLEKAAAKQAKHQAKDKTKQPKHQVRKALAK